MRSFLGSFGLGLLVIMGHSKVEFVHLKTSSYCLTPSHDPQSYQPIMAKQCLMKSVMGKLLGATGNALIESFWSFMKRVACCADRLQKCTGYSQSTTLHHGHDNQPHLVKHETSSEQWQL